MPRFRHWTRTGFRVWLSSPGQPPAFALLPGAAAQYGRPVTGPAAQVASGGTPPIPQSAFADSSLCTREPSLLPGTEPAWVLLPGAVAQYASGDTPQPPLCKGGTAWRSHAGGIVRPIEWFSPGLIAQRGSAGCQRRHFVNPTGGIRRHLPLHKGGFFALIHTTNPGSVA